MSDDLVERLDNLWAMLEEEGYYVKANTAVLAKNRIEELEDHLRMAMADKEAAEAERATAYEDAAKVAIDYINGDLAQPEMGIWWNIMKSAQSDTTAALERVRREARNEALEEALLMAELYPQPHGSRIANKIRAMMINGNDHIEEQEAVLAKAEDDWDEDAPEVVRLIRALIKLKCSDDEREYMIGHKLLSTWDYKR